MKYFVHEAERKESHSSCYFEFQRGPYRETHWRQDSVSISGDIWDELELSDLFGKVLHEFAYCGITCVSQGAWNGIVKFARNSRPIWVEVVEELTPWVENCFAVYDVFTILGL